MKDRDPSQSRYVRRQRQRAGQDDEEEQDEQFKKDPKKAIKSHFKKSRTANVQSQIEYFGCPLEPYSMHQDEEMGQIDEDGFFVFRRKAMKKDAWLQSIKEDLDEDIHAKISKRVVLGGGYKSLYQDQQIDNEVEEEEKQSEEEEDSGQKEVKEEEVLTAGEIKLLLSECLPYGTKVARHMKELKKKKQNEEYQRVLYLCNLYVELTEDASIFHMCREDFEEEEDAQNQKKEQIIDAIEVKMKDKTQGEDKDQDDIF